jgi:beta-xylosidase
MIGRQIAGLAVAISMCGCATVPVAPAARSGNPILQGWYADPEAHVFDGQYWIYPTYSAPYDQQTFLDAFSSRDLVTWTKHPHALDTANVAWARRAVWAPSIVRKDGWYYFMWSEGGWTGPNYAVAYAIGPTPLGPFERVGKILQQDSTVATGAGHHSVLHSPDSSKWYIVYHRRPLGETDRNHRVVSIDEMRFDARGMIEPVVITRTGVVADPLPPASD